VRKTERRDREGGRGALEKNFLCKKITDVVITVAKLAEKEKNGIQNMTHLNFLSFFKK